jgi:hypothetical protein
MPKLKLTYFDFHGGRGEPARLALSIGGIPFEGADKGCGAANQVAGPTSQAFWIKSRRFSSRSLKASGIVVGNS